MRKYSHVSTFQLEGRFLGFAAEDGYKLKLLRLSTSSGEYQVKVPKELRPFLYRTLVPGDWLQVSGHQKIDPFKGITKLKADRVMPLTSHQPSAPSPLKSVPPSMRSVVESAERSDRSSCTKPATILVCQKSDCCKRGAAAVTKALQSELSDRGLTDQVKICGTGCMKQCKAGPNLVMPNKSRYTRIRADEVAALLDKHFSGTGEIAS